MSISKRNKSGCYDMTAYEALSAVSKAERKAKRKAKRNAKNKTGPAPNLDYPRVYICSPYRGDVETNVLCALFYCRFALDRDKFPIAPHCYLPQFMNDTYAKERELALSFGLRLLAGCREIWVFGNTISEGMKLEIDAAKKRHIPIRYFSKNCEEVTR